MVPRKRDALMLPTGVKMDGADIKAERSSDIKSMK